MEKVREIAFTEASMRKIPNVKEALAIFLKQGYGYKQIVKAYFEAYEISDGRGNSFSVAPYAGMDLKEVYEKLPNNFKQALPVEVVQKQADLFKKLAEASEKLNKPLKEVAKEYFKPRDRNDENVRPPFNGEIRNPFNEATKA
jgi:hypothetical protein